MNSLVPRNCQSSFKLLSKIYVIGTPNTVNKREFHYNPAYYHRLGKDRLVYRNLGQQLRRAAEKYGQRLALISCAEQQQITFDAVREEAGILANYLLSLGLQRGDHVGIWAPNTKQWYISFLAAALVGLPLVCINPALKAQELEFSLRKAKVKALITMDACGKQDFVQVLQELLPTMKSNEPLVASTELPHLTALLLKSTKTWQTAHNYDALFKDPPRSHNIAYLYLKSGVIPAESTCNLQFTSGTTGEPKVTELSHFSCVNQAHLFGAHLELESPNRRICCNVPFFHAFGTATLIAALEYGATLVLPSENFNGNATLDAIEKHSCNVVLGTPTMYVDMLEKQAQQKRCVDSLELGLVGGAACAPKINKEVRKVFGLKTMKVGYGMTEGTSGFFTQDSEELSNTSSRTAEHVLQTVGRLYDHGEAKVINEHGETVSFGQPGELRVRGFFNMKGYFEDPEKTREVLSQDGWLKTGDEFILEENGIGRVVGRKKDMVIRGGENIFPRQIEDTLQLHDDILEAQVIGVPDERYGEELCVYIRPRPGTTKLTDEDVQAFCSKRLSHFKVPRYVRFVEDFPKTTTGKIQKFKLKEMFNSEAKA